jgi:hypothetical protein
MKPVVQRLAEGASSNNNDYYGGYKHMNDEL